MFPIGLALSVALRVCMPGPSTSTTEYVLHVSTEGSDSWSGRLATANSDRTDGPLATLEGARDAVRGLKAGPGLPTGGVTVRIAAGVYSRRATFELNAMDSGTADAPIVYRGVGLDRARFVGGAMVEGFGPVTDEAVRNRFDPESIDHILVADLRALGITQYGTPLPQGFGRGELNGSLELYFGGERMQLARWPNTEWAHIAEVPSGQDGGVFTYAGDRPDRWADDRELWIHGYWTWDWADSFERIARIEKAKKHLYTAPPHGVYGYKQGARFYFLNVIEELDTAGEWYLDRARGLLYFWPPAALEGAEASVSMLEVPLVTMEGVSHVTLRGLAFEGGRSGGLTITGGAHNLVAGCTFSQFGTAAVKIDGVDNGLLSCDLYQLGKGGVVIGGGDRNTLTPAGNFAVNNHIHDFGQTVRTYVPAVSVSGVGNRIAHNWVHDAPHMAIGLRGNDHMIEFNDVHDVCLETHDSGAFYMGRDWSQRGNVVQFNHLHRLGRGDVQAIYLDDWTSGVKIYGNICEGARRGVLIGGGRDNRVENNLFIDCAQAVHIDERGKGWAKYYFDGSTTTLFDRLEAVDATGPIYTARYPELATLLDDDPVSAKGNVVARNIRFGGGWLELRNGLSVETGYLTFADNWIQGDPGFINPTSGDYRLREDAPVLRMGFEPLPRAKMGLFEDEYR
jgi:Right handed beta helix region